MNYRRAVTTMYHVSTSRLLHREQTSRSRRSGTEVSAPYRAAIFLGRLTACGLSIFSCDGCRAPVLFVPDADRTLGMVTGEIRS